MSSTTRPGRFTVWCRNPQCGHPSTFPRKLSESGLFSSSPTRRRPRGTSLLDQREPWADHAVAERLVAIPGRVCDQGRRAGLVVPDRLGACEDSFARIGERQSVEPAPDRNADPALRRPRVAALYLSMERRPVRCRVARRSGAEHSFDVSTPKPWADDAGRPGDSPAAPNASAAITNGRGRRWRSTPRNWNTLHEAGGKSSPQLDMLAGIRLTDRPVPASAQTSLARTDDQSASVDAPRAILFARELLPLPSGECRQFGSFENALSTYRWTRPPWSEFGRHKGLWDSLCASHCARRSLSLRSTLSRVEARRWTNATHRFEGGRP